MMKVKYYKCPVCSKKFKTLNGWGSHMNTEHPETIPEGYTIARYFYYTMTGKTHGVCRTCKKDTPWNENTMKYDQYCGNPKCKEAYVKIAKQRMIGKYGKVHLLNDPNQQKKMLENRRISGKYRFEDGTEFSYVGSYEKEFLQMLNTMMEWHSNDLIAPSPHTYYYDYENPNDDKSNWGRKFYIPDFYIPSLNLEVEIKQSTSTNQEFIDIVRVKEHLKDEVMNSNKEVNYLKLLDNDFTKFFEFLLKSKENIPTDEELRKNVVGVMESMSSTSELYLDDLCDELDINDSEYDIANETDLLYTGLVLVPTLINGVRRIHWKKHIKNLSNIGKSIKESKLIAPLFVKVKVEDGHLELSGINYKLLTERIKEYYIDKSINNIFIPNYNAMSYKKYEKKKIRKADIKIDYISTPEFFALELVKLFVELGERYKDKVYLKTANLIYEKSWLAEADRNEEATPNLDTSKLNNLTLKFNNYQEEFIEVYPKLKAQLNLKGYILAFEQGLGKTLTAIGLSECLSVDHVYIVCPNSLKENWALEIKKYYDKYKDDVLWNKEVFICNNEKSIFNKKTTKYIITNNESIEKMFPYVLSGKNMLILDESHNFRNLESVRFKQLLTLKEKLNCSDTLIMSGTPIKAMPSEIVPALMMIDPIFNVESATIFTKAFKLKETLGSSLIQNRFGKIMYRKEKDVLENKLPEKYISEMSVSVNNSDKYLLSTVGEEINTRFTEIYKQGEKEMHQLKDPFFKFADSHNPSSVDKNRFHALVRKVVIREAKETELHELDQQFIRDYISKAKQAIKKQDDKKYFDFLIKNYFRYSAHCLGKAMGEILPNRRTEMFIDMYESNKKMFYDSILTNTKKTLIFSQFKNVVKYIYQDLNDNDIGTVIITGDVNDRMSVLRDFKENDNIRVLVATSQTIGTGVTLTEASQMFFFGPPWRASDFEQCSDRIHRIGQTDDVYIKTVTLSTGNKMNLSTRMDKILAWSKKMTESVISVTDDVDSIGDTNFEEMLAMESDMLNEEPFNVEEEPELKLIPKKLVDKMIEYETGFRYIKPKASLFIPKNAIIDKYAVDSPEGTHGKFKDMQFSKLGNAVFGNVDGEKKAPVRFEYVIDNGHEYWMIVTNIDIKEGTVLFYNPNEGSPTFADPWRV